MRARTWSANPQCLWQPEGILTAETPARCDSSQPADLSQAMQFAIVGRINGLTLAMGPGLSRDWHIA
jgi:hypothetical protein